MTNTDHTKVIFTFFELAEAIAFCTYLGTVDKLKFISDKEIINKDVLECFIKSKKLGKITQLTSKQLKQPCCDFSSFNARKEIVYTDQFTGYGL